MKRIDQPKITDYLFPIGTREVLILDPAGNKLAEISATSMGGVSCMAKGIYTNTGRVPHYRFTGTALRQPLEFTVRNQGGHLALSVDCALPFTICAELPKTPEPGRLHLLRNGLADRIDRLIGGPTPIRQGRAYDFQTGREIDRP